MKIELHMPRLFDADVTYDPETRVITIVPISKRGVVPLLGVNTISDTAGKEPRRSVVNFDLGNGTPTLQTKRQQEAGASFDDPDTPTKAGSGPAGAAPAEPAHAMFANNAYGLTTSQQHYQAVAKQMPQYWVAVFPDDFNDRPGVFPFANDMARASQFASAEMDKGSACFIFHGVYIPSLMPLQPYWPGVDPEAVPQVELHNGRPLDGNMIPDCLAAYRRMTLAQTNGTVAEIIADVGDAVDISEPGGTSESGEVANGTEVAPGFVPPPEIVETHEVDSESEDFDEEGAGDFDDLPP